MIRKKSFLYIGLFLFLAAGSLLYWLVGTNAGARYVVKKLVRYTPGTVKYGDVKGSFVGGLKLERVHVKSPDMEISFRYASLKWNPLSLLDGLLEIDTLHLEGVRVNDPHPQTAGLYDLAWPRSPALLSWLRGRVKSLRVTGFTYSEAGREVFPIDTVKARVVWLQGTLSMEDLFLTAPSWSVRGVASAGFGYPTLSLNGRVTTAAFVSALKEYDVHVKLAGDRGKKRLTGTMSLSAMADDREKVKLNAVVGLGQGRIALSKLDVRETGRAGVVTGETYLEVSTADRPFQIRLAAAGLGVSKDADSTTITGSMEVKGDRRGYTGVFNLKSTGKPWDEADAHGIFDGDFDGIHFSRLTGNWLNGSFNGHVRTSWSQGYSVSGFMGVKGIDPARITPDWPGKINMEIRTDLAWSRVKAIEGNLRIQLLNSEVRKRSLTGHADLQWVRGLITIVRGGLKGNGFDLTARGPLRERLIYQARVTDMGGLVPRGKGRFFAEGWVRHSGGQWTGTLRGEGNAIRAGDTGVDFASVEMHVGERTKDDLRIKMSARNITRGSLHFGSPELNITGGISDHEIRMALSWPNAGVTVHARGGYGKGSWSGTIDSVRGTDKYAGDFKSLKQASIGISREKIALASFVLAGDSGEYLELDGNLFFKHWRGTFNARWEKIKLARANPVIAKGSIEGHFSGSIRSQMFENRRLKLSGTSSATIILAREQVVVRLAPACSMDWDGRGLRITGHVDIDRGGRLEGRFTSDEPARLKVPDSGVLNVRWSNVDLNPFGAWILKGFALMGKTSGTVQGSLVSGSRFAISGSASMSGASARWRSKSVVIRTAAEKADIDFTWRDSTLKGKTDLRFSGNGRLQGTFHLPFRARFPVAADRTGPLDVRVKGTIQETGIISVFFPGVIEETAGRLSFEFSQGGTWGEPRTQGYLRLANATAYVPATGTRITDVASEINLAGDQVEVRSFTARSGSGHLRGTGTFFLKGWDLSGFKAKLEGDRFRVVYLPELQLLANPDLTFEGDGRKIVVRGTVVLPHGIVRDREDKEVVRASEDARIIDRPKKKPAPRKTILDAEVSVRFGENVRVAAEGLEGRLTGNVTLTAQDTDRILGKGVVRIVGGRFAGYGLKLDVARGNIVLDGGPVERAALDIMAVRTFNPGSFDQVRAGITVTGSVVDPFIRLYSEPSMSDSDVLSYLMFGRPLRASGEADQTALLLKSAGMLFGGARGAGLQEQIQQRLGFDVLEVTEGPSGAYASSRTKTAGSLEQSMITVGKYLSPKLYIAYGRSLFSDEYLVSARYSLDKRFELETRAGTQTSIDLYYKLEFF